MTQKIMITDEMTATFICPECSKAKDADVAKYKNIEKLVRLKVKCACGNSYSVILERRKSFRKQTNLPGKFICQSPGGQQKKVSMTVADISREGLKITVAVMPKLEIGERIYVEFHLDDKQQSLIKKDAVVRSKSDKFIGVEFCPSDSTDPGDRALRFYLF